MDNIPVDEDVNIFTDIFLQQAPIRDALFQHLQFSDILCVRATNTVALNTCNSYIDSNRDVRITIKQSDYEAFLMNTIGFGFSEVLFDEIIFNSNDLNALKSKIRKCDRMILHKCQLNSANITDTIACSENLEQILIDLDENAENFEQYIFHNELPRLIILSIQQDIIQYARVWSLLLIMNVQKTPNLHILSLPLQMYIWFSKYAEIMGTTIQCIHVKWQSAMQVDFDDIDVITAIAAPVYQHIFLGVNRSIYNNKKGLIDSLNIPFKMYDEDDED